MAGFPHAPVLTGVAVGVDLAVVLVKLLKGLINTF
jgi:hypothetical protein